MNYKFEKLSQNELLDMLKNIDAISDENKGDVIAEAMYRLLPLDAIIIDLEFTRYLKKLSKIEKSKK